MILKHMRYTMIEQFYLGLTEERFAATVIEDSVPIARHLGDIGEPQAIVIRKATEKADSANAEKPQPANEP